MYLAKVLIKLFGFGDEAEKWDAYTIEAVFTSYREAMDFSNAAVDDGHTCVVVRAPDGVQVGFRCAYKRTRDGGPMRSSAPKPETRFGFLGLAKGAGKAMAETTCDWAIKADMTPAERHDYEERHGMLE